MGSYLETNDGTYGDGLNGRPERRFVITNWTDEDVYSRWDGRPIVIKAGDLYECGHAIAIKITREIVDREIFRLAAKATVEKERERIEMGVLNADIRKPYEDKTIQEIKVGEENPVISKLREEIRAEERAKMSGDPEAASNAAAGISTRPNVPGEFEDAKK